MSSFYDLSGDQRITLTQHAITGRRTLVDRWRLLAAPEAQHWDARSALAGDWLSSYPAVADIGCGTMHLERHLKPGVTYVPIDVVARDHRTIVCDLNREPIPDVSAPAAACLGLIEYLFESEAFLAGLRGRFAACAVSYNPVDAPGTCGAPLNDDPLSGRRAHAWVNDHTSAQFSEIVERAGWTVQTVKQVDPSQSLWLLTA